MTQAPQPPAQQPIGQKDNGLALAGMILGIASLVFCCIPAAIVGLILSVKGKKKAAAMGGLGEGMAKAGVITSIVGIVLPTVIIIAVLALVSVRHHMRHARFCCPMQSIQLKQSCVRNAIYPSTAPASRPSPSLLPEK